MSWLEFWNKDTPIYVNGRHKAVHYRVVAEDIARALPGDGLRVLDFGCGEALSAHVVAARCSLLTLSDGAALTRERLIERFGVDARIQVLAPAEVEALPPGSFDVIVANSVVQYLSVAEFERLLVAWRRLLAPGGRLILGDIVTRSVGPLADAMVLLRLAWANGFLVAAGLGLVRTAFSDYRSKRAQFGLLRFEEAELLDLLARHGWTAHRRPQNIGYNPSRMTAVAVAAG